MAQYGNDFTNPSYSIGTRPSDWSRPWNTTFDWTVQVGGADRVLELTNPTATGRYAASSTTVGNVADAEIVGRFRVSAQPSSTTAICLRLTIRGSGTDAAPTGYLAELTRTATTNQLQPRVGLYNGATTFTSVTTGSAFSYTFGNWLWVRFRVNSNSLQFRIWADGTTEPGTWTISTTNSVLTAAGFVAVGAGASASTTVFQYDFVGVGTGADTAPIDATVTAVPSTATASSVAPAIGLTASTTFSEYTSGVFPSGWSKPWDTGAFWVVVTGGDDKILDGFQDTPLAGHFVASWDRVDSPTDAEIVVKWRVPVLDATTLSLVLYRMVLRGAGTNASPTGYLADFVTSATTANQILPRLSKYVSSGSATGLSLGTATAVTNGSWYWGRFRVTGSSIQMRWWADGTSEPGTWTISATDTSIAATGWTALGTEAGAVLNFDYDQAGFGTGGLSAPIDATVTAVAGAATAASTPAFVAATVTLVSGPAQSAASMSVPTIRLGYTALAPPALATATAGASTIRLVVQGAPAAATGNATGPIVSAGTSSVAPPSATAIASAPAPVMAAGILLLALPGQAMASSPTPAIASGSTATAQPSFATALSIGPIITASIAVPIASVLASANVPIVTATCTVLAVPGLATADSAAPAIFNDEVVHSLPMAATAFALPPTVHAGATVTVLSADASATGEPPNYVAETLLTTISTTGGLSTASVAPPEVGVGYTIQAPVGRAFANRSFGLSAVAYMGLPVYAYEYFSVRVRRRQQGIVTVTPHVTCVVTASARKSLNIILSTDLEGV